MNEEIIAAVAGGLGAIIGFIIRDFLIFLKVREIRESGKQAFEMEQRIWKEVREQLAKEKGEGK